MNFFFNTAGENFVKLGLVQQLRVLRLDRLKLDGNLFFVLETKIIEDVKR
jgi:hypothetical protein